MPTGKGELASLLIINKIHLLNEDRGAVIETIVAGILCQVESTQSLIHVVGLSDTLPNYIDVADFLGKPNSPQLRQNLDHITFDKVLELIREAHQVMTVQLAQTLWEMAMMEGALDNFSTQEHPQFIQLGWHRNE
ncbi:hypothetical protein M422DRAFT_62122 [Sphaerobolus stellatus SS14]|uniref:Uncharacterized protein n=1 Tax=Sphaerobolus stellatus (strain SS14) TaxID=990650 RepID=A0A0C9TXR3_SPHS4|nr:hypothetical protein M422DRAFT_62122 [Sphaerobolus stellatus SS14]